MRDALGPRNAALVARGAPARSRGGDARALGALMDDAQAAFDRLVAPACPELGAPRLHEVLAHPAVRELALGRQGRRVAGRRLRAVVARGPAERDALAAVLARDVRRRVPAAHRRVSSARPLRPIRATC